MWYIVRDASTMRYVLKTKDLKKAVKVLDEGHATGKPYGLYGKPMHHNQLQLVPQELIAQARG